MRTKASYGQKQYGGTSSDCSTSQVSHVRSSIWCSPKAGLCLSDRLADDLHQHAISLFFQDYTIESCDRCPGYLDFLPRLYGNCTVNSLLPVALLAAAYANMAQKLDRQDIAIKAMSHYRKALKVAYTVLSERLETTSDTTMTAIMLLGLYEVSLIQNSVLTATECLHSASILLYQR